MSTIIFVIVLFLINLSFSVLLYSDMYFSAIYSYDIHSEQKLFFDYITNLEVEKIRQGCFREMY